MSGEPSRARPRMQNYGISDQDEGMMSWAWAVEQLTASRNYWICTTRPDGNPHVAPVWGVWLDGALYFGSDDQARKVKNFRHNPRVAMHLESGDDVVILEGQVAEVHDPALLARIGEVYGAKYDLEPEDNASFWGFKPESGLTWLEKDFPQTATRWTF